MIEDNHNLIYWFINKYKLSESEYYGLLAIELCEAVIHYDESKGSLANYFHLVCNGRIYKEYRKSQAQKRTHLTETLESNFTVPIYDDYSAFKLIEDIIEDPNYLIFMLKSTGYSQCEIAKKLNISQSFVSKIIFKFMKNYKEEE
jgi:RNA polymerase sigma factor (sigma-70 family)